MSGRPRRRTQGRACAPGATTVSRTVSRPLQHQYIIFLTREKELTLRFLLAGRLGDESGASTSEVSCSRASVRRVRRRLEGGIVINMAPVGRPISRNKNVAVSCKNIGIWMRRVSLALGRWLGDCCGRNNNKKNQR